MRRPLLALALASAVRGADGFLGLHCTAQAVRHGLPMRATVPSDAARSVGEEAARVELARKEAAYRERQQQLRAQQLETVEASTLPSLGSLELRSYLTAEGKISSAAAPPGTKASVYAIFDEAEDLRFVGISRDVKQSLRLHLGRQPVLCHGFKVRSFCRPACCEKGPTPSRQGSRVAVWGTITWAVRRWCMCRRRAACCWKASVTTGSPKLKRDRTATTALRARRRGKSQQTYQA